MGCPAHADQMAEDVPLVSLDTNALKAARLLDLWLRYVVVPA